MELRLKDEEGRDTFYERADAKNWRVVYRIHVSGRIQGFQGFQHEMGDGGSSCKRCRPLQTELTGAPYPYGSYQGETQLGWSLLTISTVSR